ncbi:MAG: TetR/AcrR family transcriptional regulator [Sphingobium sp.]
MNGVALVEHRRMRGRPRKNEGPDSAEILRAAIAAFARYGWEGTNLRQVAETAGVDSSLIIRRFDGKMGLWTAIVDHVSDRVRQAFDISDGGEPMERLAAAVDGFVRLNIEMPDLGRFFIDQMARPGERRHYVIEKMWLGYKDALLPFVEAAHFTDDRRGIGQSTYIALLLGAITMPLLMRSVALGDLDDPAIRDRFVRDVTTLFVRG